MTETGAKNKLIQQLTMRCGVFRTANRASGHESSSPDNVFDRGALMESWEWRHPPKRPRPEGCNSPSASAWTSSPRSDPTESRHRRSATLNHLNKTGSPLKSFKVRNPQLKPSNRRQTPIPLISQPWVTVATALVVAMGALMTLPSLTEAVVPLFHEATKMSALRLPADTPLETIVYRLRASDAEKDYPLLFGIRGTIGNNLIRIDTHECSHSSNVFCEADVLLKNKLEAGRVYIFNLTVSDTRGDQTEVVARIDATFGRTPINTIFLTYEPSILVPEDQALQTEITSLVVRKRRSSSFIEFDILGDTSHHFRITGKLVSSDEIRGSLTLSTQLDYETRNLHNIKVCAMNPYTDEQIDTRNIACVGVSVAVEDRQDEAPIFLNAPPITRIPPTIQPGDVLVQLTARDGDQGEPRPLRFSILPVSASYSDFFKVDPFKGSVEMVETITKLMEKMVTMEPILMTVTAEEVETSVTQYPALSTKIEIAFVLVDSDLPLPKFVYQKYAGEIRENSPPDSQVYFASPFLSRVSLEDKVLTLTQGVKGIFSLTIEGDDGIFAVTPSVIRDSSDFVINVKNSQLLDYEARKSVAFKLIARPVTGGRQTSSEAEITVSILDTNDNSPVFSMDVYQATFYENITASTSILRVTATDQDSGSYASVRYTRLNGRMADRLSLDPITGVITCATNNHDFDRDHNSEEYQLTVEARDDDGSGNSATARIILRVKDVNDEAPQFKLKIYEGVLNPNGRSLREPINIEAIDEDAEEPNNQINYMLERTAYSDYFVIDLIRGVLKVRTGVEVPRLPFHRTRVIHRLDAVVRKKRQAYPNVDTAFESVDRGAYIPLTVRATDLGSPPQSSIVTVRIYTKEYVEMSMTFVYPLSASEVNRYQGQVRDTLEIITGASTDITRVEPYRGGLKGTEQDAGKSFVTAVVRTPIQNTIDVELLAQRLGNQSSQPFLQKQAESEREIADLQSLKSSYVAGVVFLCIALAIIILILLACCFCAGCPLYTGRKQMSMVTDENGEGISYIKMDEYGNMRQENEKIWWDYLPTCCTDLFLSCGCQRPDNGRYISNSRMAWSGDERQRYWRTQQQGGGALLDDGNVTRRQPRDMMHIEDVDEARLHRQNVMQGGMQQGGMQNAAAVGAGGEPRRLFVLKDPNGNPQPTDHLREGETYLVEDVDETPRNIHLQDAQGNGEYARNPGNGEPLRLHAGPRDVALLTEQLRRSKRAGEEPGGTQSLHGDDGGGGMSTRHGDGYSMGVTPRGDGYEDYTGNGTNYVHGSGSAGANKGGPGRRRQLDDTVVPRLRIRSPNEEEMMDDIEDLSRVSHGKIHSYRHDRPDRRGGGGGGGGGRGGGGGGGGRGGGGGYDGGGGISDREKAERDYHEYLAKGGTGQYAYQHTKASILRYESNMAKLEEDEQAEAERDPLYNTMRRNSAIKADARRAAAYAAEDDSLETRRTLSQAALELKNRKDAVGWSYDKQPELERSGSVPNIQTNLEKEAAQRSYSRRGSLAEDEYYDENNKKVKRSARSQRSFKQSKRKDEDSKSQNEKSGSNVSDDVKSQSAGAVSGEMDADALRALEEQMKKDSEEGDEASKAATDRSRKKRNQMTEKKSIFTIAYDDMQTKQLRPDSAAPDP